MELFLEDLAEQLGIHLPLASALFGLAEGSEVLLAQPA